MSKKKKEKIVYYDDGSTIADMSGVSKGRKTQQPKQPTYIENKRQSTFGDKWRTYWSSVKMMFIPMLVVLLILTLLFLGMLAIGQSV